MGDDRDYHNTGCVNVVAHALAAVVLVGWCLL